jgi:outer membrane protein OmpA-like peptidoglycan-associated protein
MVKRPLDVQFLRLSEEVNRFPANYNPVVSWDDSTLIYMTDRPLYRAIMMSRRLADGGWTEPRVINDEIGSDGNCYPASLSANGKELYLVKKDPYGSDIYISYLKNGRFTKMIPLNRNINSDYSETHACISFNGKQLYFTSDRPGGQGGLDIWVAETNEEGDWGEPRNLGPVINSHYSEETPFLAGRGRKLYFSSQGHATMGGFDFFVSERIPGNAEVPGPDKRRRRSETDAAGERWSAPKNLGYPISTADDDLFYYPRKNGQGAYLSAVMDEISPTRSIYTFRVKGEEVRIASRRKGEEKTDGTLALKTKTGRPGKEKVQPAEPDSVAVVETVQEDSLQPPVRDGLTATENDYFVLNSILFGFDSDELTTKGRAEADRVLEVLHKNPDVSLHLTGHTDAVGSDEYNLRLSRRRAQAVADYLVSKGVEVDRIQVSAAGESRPIAINEYEDGSDSPEGRRLNRHVSIKLENLQSPNVRVEDIFVPDHLRPERDKSYSVLLVQSDVRIDTIPDEVAGEQTVLIMTDSAFLYTAGNFRHKVEAMQYLNEVIDVGYPEAGMLEDEELERLIASLSEQGIMVTASFTIQIMALKNPVPVEQFTRLQGVVMYAGHDGFHRYVHGDYKSIRDAMEKLPSIRKMGFHDAFIMSILRYEKLAR